MKLPAIIVTAALACTAGMAVAAQPEVIRESIQVENFIGPFTPTPEGRAAARKEAYAAYAWNTRVCRQTERGQALAGCLREVSRDRNLLLAFANGGPWPYTEGRVKGVQAPPASNR